MERVAIEEQLAQLRRAHAMWEWSYGRALNELQNIEEQMQQLTAQLNAQTGHESTEAR